ncbi:DMT family transporter, partial [Bacteriovoracaceae bacterium]|nr:DMT family transporter [Bacteriovoracaceae bacterium]
PILTPLITIQSILNFFGLAIIGGVLPYLLMVIGQKKVSANVAGPIYLLEPVFATVLAAIFLSEQLTLEKTIGGFLILLGPLLNIERKPTY